MFGAYKRAPMSARPAAAVAKNTVLCVDDSAVARTFVRKALEKGGITVLEAVNAADANKVLHETPVRLVIVDWNMPGMDGGELVRKLRLIPGMADAKVIFITGDSSVERIEEAEAIGCDAFIPKPFKPDELLLCVRALLIDKPADQR
jgi:CheY-like chemotaxis protein